MKILLATIALLPFAIHSSYHDYSLDYQYLVKPKPRSKSKCKTKGSSCGDGAECCSGSCINAPWSTNPGKCE